MNGKQITTQVVVAYSRCPRKAFNILCTDEPALTHEYARILAQRRQQNEYEHLGSLPGPYVDLRGEASPDLSGGAPILIRARLKSEPFDAYCPILTKMESSESPTATYEPTIIIGSHRVDEEHRLELTFAGFVLGQQQNGCRFPAA